MPSPPGHREGIFPPSWLNTKGGYHCQNECSGQAQAVPKSHAPCAWKWGMANSVQQQILGTYWTQWGQCAGCWKEVGVGSDRGRKVCGLGPRRGGFGAICLCQNLTPFSALIHFPRSTWSCVKDISGTGLSRHTKLAGAYPGPRNKYSFAPKRSMEAKNYLWDATSEMMLLHSHREC